MSDTSLDSLFRRCHRDLLRFFRRRVGSAEVAAELAQETFLRVLRADPSTAVRNPRAYLFRTANNLVIDHYRAANAQHFQTIDECDRAAIESAELSPEAAILSREELEVLRQAIEDLPPRGREVFVLHRFEGLSYAQIAARLGIAKNTVIVHMVRSLAHCRRRLNDYRQGVSLGE